MQTSRLRQRTLISEDLTNKCNDFKNSMKLIKMVAKSKFGIILTKLLSIKSQQAIIFK